MKDKIKVIPKPNKITIYPNHFKLNFKDTIEFEDENSPAAAFLVKLTGLKKAKSGKVKLLIDKTIAGDEAYRLSINSEGVSIIAYTDAGLFYGVQTLRQMLPVEAEKNKITAEITLPYVEIEDEPRYEYRGFMFDSSRHFFEIDVIKSLLDMMALHKLNRFHWHLTDDQGFRLEVDKYPKLKEISSKRKRSQIKGSLMPWTRRYDNAVHEGSYSKNDIKEIVNYAKNLYIEVIPEIDFPGHVVSVLAAYPEYSCMGGPFEVWSRWGISKDVLCAGKERSLDFIKDILSQAAEQFPFKHIHIGGDEVPKARWKNCLDCQKLMNDKGYKNEKELQEYITNEIAAFLKEKGCQVIGWDEILEGNLDEDIIVQSWSIPGKKRVIKSIQEGRKCIISNYFKYYLDHSYNIVTLKNSYEFNPQLEGLTDEQGKNILGVEAPLWTEAVGSIDRIHWQMFPRLTAVSETGWTHNHLKDYTDFTDRLKEIEKRYSQLGVKGAVKECYSYEGKPKIGKLIFGKDHPAVVEHKKYQK